MKPKRTRDQRIELERRRLHPRPWEFTPSETDGRECPYPQNTAGFASWQRAVEMHAEILEHDPTYFD